MIYTYQQDNINITYGAKTPIKEWTIGVPVEEDARKQLKNVADLPFIFKHVAVMPDVHVGIGATIGSVVPTKGAIVPAITGVDIGCGMHAVRLNIKANDLPDNLFEIRSLIEKAIPHGRTNNGGQNDRGAWSNPPLFVQNEWKKINDEYKRITGKHPKAYHKQNYKQLGTLGTGNHFIELCLDEMQNVWVMLHSGSRGPGNVIGSYFISLAKEDMGRNLLHLPDQNLAYLEEGSEHFNDYIEAVNWAQKFAYVNRNIMIQEVLNVLKSFFPNLYCGDFAINCHHNYVQKESHFGEDIYITRKGAVNASKGTLGIIPGSMGAKSFIVRGLGNPESFCSCSHGAGRKMSRGEAKRKFKIEDHIEFTKGVECRKDEGVIDETPGAYKDIDLVMTAQSDLVEVVHTLKQVLCVKG